MPDDFTPPDDLADQQAPVGRDDTEDFTGVPADIDPADFADQHRDAPVLGDGEPWP